MLTYLEGPVHEAGWMVGSRARHKSGPTMPAVRLDVKRTCISRTKEKLMCITKTVL